MYAAKGSALKDLALPLSQHIFREQPQLRTKMFKNVLRNDCNISRIPPKKGVCHRATAVKETCDFVNIPKIWTPPPPPPGGVRYGDPQWVRILPISDAKSRI